MEPSTNETESVIRRAPGRVVAAVHELEHKVEDSKLSTGTPSRSLMGLPLLRLIPQDVHSVLDYASAATSIMAGMIADTEQAKLAATALGGTVLATSLMTDYKLSLAKVVPIEVHEVADYVAGAANIAAPFVLGYAKKDPLVAAMQVFTGATQILASLFTDYRAIRRKRTRRAAAGNR